MKPFVVNKDSFSYKLNKRVFWDLADLNEHYQHNTLPKDFCTYWRHFTYSVLISLAVIALLAAIIIPLLVIAFTKTTEFLIATGATAIIILSMILFAMLYDSVIVGAIRWLAPRGLTRLIKIVGFPIKWLIWVPLSFVTYHTFAFIFKVIERIVSVLPKREKNVDTIEREPSIIYQKYRSIKDKICPMVEYTS